VLWGSVLWGVGPAGEVGFAVAVEAFAGEFSAIDRLVAIDADGVHVPVFPHVVPSWLERLYHGASARSMSGETRLSLFGSGFMLPFWASGRTGECVGTSAR